MSRKRITTAPPEDSVPLSMHKEIGGGDKVDRHDYGDQQAADDRASQRRILFAARFGSDRHRDHAEKRGEGSHQDGAQTHAGSERDGFFHRFAFVVQVTGKFHDQNAVRNDDADHHDHSHQRHHIQSGPR